MSPAFCTLMDQSVEGAYCLCVHSDRRCSASNSESRAHCVKAMVRGGMQSPASPKESVAWGPPSGQGMKIL